MTIQKNPYLRLPLFFAIAVGVTGVPINWSQGLNEPPHKYENSGSVAYDS